LPPFGQSTSGARETAAQIESARALESLVGVRKGKYGEIDTIRLYHQWIFDDPAENPPFQTREARPFPAEPYRPAAIDRGILSSHPQAGRLGEFFLNSTSRAYFVNQNIAFRLFNGSFFEKS